MAVRRPVAARTSSASASHFSTSRPSTAPGARPPAAALCGTSSPSLAQPFQRNADSRCSVTSSGPRSTPGARRSSASSLGALHRHRPGRRSSSTRGSPSAPSCPTSSPARRSRSWPSRRSSSSPSGRASDVGRHHRHVPDVLPGDHRRDPRPALARPARARADALVRGVALGDLSGRCACRRRCRTCSRRSRSRPTASIVGAIIGEGPGGDPGRPGAGHRQLQPAVHHRPGEAVGDDPRRLARWASRSSPCVSRRRVGCALRGRRPSGRDDVR